MRVAPETELRNPLRDTLNAFTEDSICIICFDDRETEYLTLDCRHTYHKKCIQQWMHIRMNCPICIQTIDPRHSTQELRVELQHISELEQDGLTVYEREQRQYANFLSIMCIFAIFCVLIGIILIL